MWLGVVGSVLYDFPLSMFMASVRVVSILCVLVLCPYAWVKVVFMILWMCVVSSCVSALSLLLGICVGCIWGGFDFGWHACVGLWRFVGRS